MGTYVFSGGDGSYGFNMLGWGAEDIVAMVSSVYSSSHSTGQVTYSSGGEYLQARGTLTGFDEYGDPTVGTVTSFTYTTTRFGASPMSITASGISLGVSTLYNWIFAGNWLALHNFLFGGADTMTGSIGADLLEGYGGGDTINGGAGDDLIFGENYPGADHLSSVVGADTLNGGEGHDTLFGQGGNDTLRGDAGNDLLVGGVGNDVLDGGAGFDAAAYVDATSGVVVSLALTTQQNTVGAGLDTLIGVEDLLGSLYNDTLTGNASNNFIAGSDGNDILDGAGGIDTASYLDSLSGVTVSLAVAGQQNTGGGGIDRLSNFENLQGSDFNDVLGGNAGGNILDGGAGIDTVSYAAALAGVSVSLATTGAQNTGGAGVDTLYSFENVTGSAFADTLIGSTSNNVINGGGGNDVLDGGAGVDVLQITPSSNAAVTYTTSALFSTTATVLSNGLTVSNFERADILAGGGDDVFVVSSTLAGASVFNGGAGTDRFVLDYSAGAFQLNMTGTNVVLLDGGSVTVSVEEYWITGGSAEDTLRGAAGADVLNGGGHDDRIYAGYGDSVDGGVHNSGDILYLDLSAATQGMNLDFGLSTVANGAGVITGIEDVAQVIGSNFDDVIVLNSTSYQHQFSSVLGGGGNDTIVGDYYTQTLAGDAGDDVLDGRASQYLSTMTGGAGADEFYFGRTYATAYGGDGDDIFHTYEFGYFGTVQGGAGNDTVLYEGGDSYGFVGGDGIDTLDMSSVLTGSVIVNLQTESMTGYATMTLAGVEYVIGGALADSLTGNDAANTFEGGAGGDALDGGGGADTASYARAAAAVSLVFGNLAASTGDAAGDTFTSIEILTGSAFADTISWDDNANMLDGGDGDDELSGNGGDDWLIGGLGADTLHGGIGNDMLRGGAGADALNGGDGYDIADYVYAAAGISLLYNNLAAATGDAAGDTFSSVEIVSGSAFNDVIGWDNNANIIEGGAGDDTLYGNGGDDWLLGGDGNDTLEGGVGADLNIGGAGVDTASYANASSRVSLIFTSLSGAIGDAAGDLFDSIECVTGSAYNDTLSWDNNANIIDGGAGNDLIFGNGGSDWLFGGAGTDTLNGGVGDDLLRGGLGADVLNGGTGYDNADYVYASAGVSLNFFDLAGSTGEAAGDTFSSVEILSGSAFDDVLAWDNNANIIDSGDGHDTISGNGGNDWLLARAGDDTLDGGAGADILIGDIGDDTFVFQAGQGQGDTIVDFAGNGAAAGDALRFEGYGAGATFTQIDATHWRIASADNALQDTIIVHNGATIHASDYLFA